jgi:DNA-directed RNA polymerase specialized sigma24 family protein
VTADEEGDATRAFDAFDAFAREVEPRLWRALVPAVGPDRAAIGASHALIYAWRHWDRVSAMTNPAGYLYRVAHREANRTPRPTGPALPAPEPDALPDVEPRLVPALLELTEMQRTVVWLVEGCGWGLTDTATLLDVSVSTVRNHLARGLRRLRAALKVTTDA